MRLHIRLTLLIAVFSLVGGGATALLVSNVMHDTLEQELEKRAVVVAQTLAEHVTHIVIHGEVVAAREALQEILQRTEDVEFAYVTGFDGEVFAHSFEAGFPRALLPDEHELIRAEAPLLERYATEEGLGLQVGYPLIDGMKAHLHVGLSETYLHAQIERTRNRIVGITLVVALVAVCFGVFLNRSFARPLEKLAASLRAFGERAIEQPLDYRGGGREVADLTRSFNQMIAERMRAAAKIEHLNAVLRAIRKVNQLIVREKDRGRLLQGACDDLIETRGYYSAWVALIDASGEPVLSEAEGVVTTAEAGLGEDFTPLVERLEHGEWVYCARQALVQAGALGIEDPPSTCTDCPLSSWYGGKGGMAVRLEHGGKVYGLLTVSVPTDLVADEEERSLFEEVADDIAFGLRSIELEEERVRAEGALRESEEHYRTLFDGVPTGLNRTTPAGQILDANLALVEMLGYPDRETLLATNVADTYADAEDRKQWLALMEDEGVVRGFETRMRWHDGAIIWVESNAHAARDADGRVLYYEGSVKDITERKRAEEALREERDRAQRYLDVAGVMLVVIDADQNVRHINRQGCQILGGEEEQIVGRNWFDTRVPERLRNEVKAVFDRLMDGEVEPVEHCESPIVTRGGEERSIAWHNTLLTDDIGNAIGILSSGEDITERKRAERELEERRLYLEGVLGAAPDAIVTLDARHRMVEWNRGAERLFGYLQEEVIGQGIDGLVSRYDPFKEAVGFTQTVMGGGEVPPTETVRYRKDGSPVSVIVAASPILVGDELIGAVGVYTDITERKQAEEALKEYSERLEEMVDERTRELRDAQEKLVRKERLAVLGQLAGGVAHELRNPLGAISNAAYFLNMVTEEPEPEVKEMLEIMEKEVRTSERIISSLLDFARPQPPIRRIVDVNEVVRETLSRATVPDSVEVVRQLEEPLPTILADPDQLVQVFGNLMLNAIQAMTLPTAVGTPEGGRLVVKSQGRGDPAGRPEWVTVSITDTGEGISEENMGKLFEPLFTTKAKGIGLGLALVKTLAEANGGSIEVESEVGKGSTFTVRLPPA